MSGTKGSKLDLPPSLERLPPSSQKPPALAGGSSSSSASAAGDPAHAHRFAVHTFVDVGPPIEKHFVHDDLMRAWERLAGGKVEACAALPGAEAGPCVAVLERPSLLAQAVYTAFYEHFPLRLGPDVVWLTITQGFAHYVLNNAEALRGRFVNFEGKKTLTVERPDFVKGSPHNNWPSVFPEFSDKIAEHIGVNVRDLIECSFSTTGPTERIASHITLMDAMQGYFEYVLRGGCGIPWIELLGSLEDWQQLRAKAERLRQYVVSPDDKQDLLRVWLDALLPVLDHFVLAAEGRPDLCFWGSVCNLAGGSGGVGAPVSGWVQVFYPYLRSGFGNWGLSHWHDAYARTQRLGGPEQALRTAAQQHTAARAAGYGMPQPEGLVTMPSLSDFPLGVSLAPFTYKDLATGKEHEMTFYGGLTSIHQHPHDRALEVRTGWAVVDAPPRQPDARTRLFMAASKRK